VGSEVDEEDRRQGRPRPLKSRADSSSESRL
jgi:hypothetical protein